MRFKVIPVAICLVAITSCKKNNELIQSPIQYPEKVTLKAAGIIYTAANGVNVFGSGYGSAIAAVPNEPDAFYLMTDRGPNVDGTVKDSKLFPLPNFNPHIAKFKLLGDSLVYISSVEFKNAAGAKITGKPNPVGQGSTGEVALDFNGNTLTNDPDGIDCEGLAVAPDGSFWVSDEYGPHLAHFDKEGKTIERINPFGTGTGGRKIPEVFKKRRANRGMEGLTISPDGKILIGMMQSPMYNPTRATVANSRLLRILTFEIATGITKQYAYITDNIRTLSSEIVAITATTFLVLERDQDYAGGQPAALTKKVYKIDITNSTDISDATNSATGIMFGGKTLEELSDAELVSNNIKAVTKELVADLLTIPGGYPHDKAEGLVILNNNLIAVSNDDDFGINNPTIINNTLIAKILPSTGKIDTNVIYFIKLSKGLK
ncbi:MAG: esterase-like activity of phytase family protein [Sphingobacteriia bacterium]|nr:MAG: esterase-like activity of phytase family protein [Sphingobacteriia bacterium]TAG30092.1 MAG: esterase-like activity of phytase family protein [Sphingobacteriia bacterium]TAH07322.1 MAG: esterase-like activity of phytase family protein [Sphingobacteriia bacterium]